MHCDVFITSKIYFVLCSCCEGFKNPIPVRDYLVSRVIGRKEAKGVRVF